MPCAGNDEVQFAKLHFVVQSIRAALSRRNANARTCVEAV
jgi:hypothetical protein